MRYLVTIILALCGLPLLAGGFYLAWLGGSYWYLCAGAACLISAALHWRRRTSQGQTVYALFLVLTLAWGLFEVGLDPWGLIARLAAPACVGLLVLLPALPARVRLAVCAAMLVLVGATIAVASRGPAADRTAGWVRGDATSWTSIGSDQTQGKHSDAGQITPANVSRLRQAWIYRTGDNPPAGSHFSFEATPVLHDETLYLCTPRNIVIALDAETGRQKWRMDPHLPASKTVGTCRGVALHVAGPSSSGLCAVRVLEATLDARLIALDARTGEPCTEFGQDGTVDLTQQIGPGIYAESSPPTIVGDLAIIGGLAPDNIQVGGASGVIRAYDVHTGALRWAWDMGRPGQTGAPAAGQTYTPGTPNSWTTFSSDPALGLVYVPTGNSTPDYFGAHRSPASEKYTSSVVALDIATGLPRWSFQTVHHDIWDYDLAAPPTLVDWPMGNRMVPALVQGTKAGQVYVLDRRTGKPLMPVVETPAPQTDVAREWTAKSQPRSVAMPSLARLMTGEREMWGITPLDQLWCRIEYRKARYDGPFTPPSLRGSLTTPGWVGGVNWGGISVDPQRQLLIANSNQMAIRTTLLPRTNDAKTGNTEYDPALVAPMTGTPYKVNSEPFLSPLGVPCQQPPFGTLSAIDMRTGKLVWSHPIGTTMDSGPAGFRLGLPLPMGMPNMGGAITTRSGVTFIAATLDAYLRAFETQSGKEIARLRLPAGGQATPMTFVAPRTGRQYVVVSAGGNMVLGSRTGDYVVAYRLR